MARESISNEEAKKIGDDIKEYIEKRLEGCKLIYIVSYCAPNENKEGKRLFNSAYYNLKDNDAFFDVTNIMYSFMHTVQHIVARFTPQSPKVEDLGMKKEKKDTFGGVYR